MNEQKILAQLAQLEVSLDFLTEQCHKASADAGWWHDIESGADLRNLPTEVYSFVIGTKLALIHSEISEALEAYRRDANDDKLTDRPGIEVELADAIIRIFDLAGALKLKLGSTIQSKLEYNSRRADHKITHRRAVGGKRF